MKFKTLLKALLYAFLATTIVHCSEADDEGLFGQVDTGECAYSPYEGDQALTSAKSFQVQESGYFAKRIITDHLDSLLTSSGEHIAHYVSQQGVELYRISEKSNSECRYFAYLPTASNAAQSNWDNNANHDEDGKTLLLGLFTTYYVPNGNSNNTTSYTLREPTIMVREDTQKWTLLHEFSHYLFADARTRGPMKPNQILRKELTTIFDQLKKDQDAFEADPTEQGARKMLRSFEAFFDTSHLLDQGGPLEEFTIESMLADRLREQRLTLVNRRFDLANAIGYMRANKDLVVDRYKRLAELVDSYNDLYFEKENWTLISERAELFEAQVNEVLKFIDDKMADARELYQENSLNTSLASMSLEAISEEQHIEHHHFDMQDVILQEELYNNL